MTDKLYVSFLRAGDKIQNPDGTVTEAFRNSWNALVLRTGNQVTNDLFGVINGFTQTQATADAALAAAAAASQQANNAISGAGGSSSFYLSQDIYTASGTLVTPGQVTTDTVTFTANGGTGPYTWAYVKTSGTAFTLTASTSNATAFTSEYLNLGGYQSAVYEVTATDSLAATAKATISVYAVSSRGGSGGIIP